MSELSRSTNLRTMTCKPGEGKRFMDSPAANSGAKDSLSGKNTTQTFQPSGKVSGPYGGKNTNK